jgi:hypothetical protein
VNEFEYAASAVARAVSIVRAVRRVRDLPLDRAARSGVARAMIGVHRLVRGLDRLGILR